MNTDDRDETPNETPEGADAHGRLRAAAGAVGTSLGCLALLLGMVIATAGVVAMVLDDPVFVIAAVALLAVLGGGAAAKRRRP
jgi:hypothetical protein